MIELVSRVARHLLPRQNPGGQGDLQFDANASTGDKFLSLIASGFQSQLQGTTIVVAFLTTLLLTTLMLLLFCFVRPHNTVVYAPRAKHADSKHAPPPIGKGPFAWIMPLIKTKEDDLIEKVGLDAAIFLRFIRMLRNMFGVISILGCGILIPLALTHPAPDIPKTTSFINRITPLFMGFGSNIWWGHVVVSYLFDLVVCFFLWINYRAVLRLRRRYMESSEYQKSLHARTLLVTDIPKQYRSEEGIIRIVDEVRGTQAVPRAAIARNVKDLPDLVEEHEKTVRELEKVLAKYLKNPDKLPAQRPTCKPSKKDKAHSSGQRVDAIDYLTSRIKELEHEIKEVRLSVDNRNALGYGFASYQNIIDAHSVAYLARNKAPHDTNITLAPKPTSLIWKNLKMSKKERNWSNFINNVWILVLTLVWFVPNVLIAVFLSNLANIGLLWPAFQQNIEQNITAWSVVQAIAAPAITSLFYFYLPAIFRKLRNNAGDITKTQRERHVTHKLFAFFLVNNLIIFSLFSTLFGFFAALAKDKTIGASEVFTNLINALVTSTTYWMAWLLQRNLGAAIDLSQIVNLSWGSLMRRFGSPTPRETIELSAPQPFDYAAYYNYFLFYTAVGLTFGTLQPLLLPVVLLYFWIDSFVKKYMLLYIFITKHESGGMFWRTLFNRVLIATVLGNFVVALLVVARTGNGSNVKVNWQMLAALVPLPILLILFKWYCSRAFDTEMHFYQTGKALLDSEMQGESEHKRRGDRVGVRFGHPVLYKPLITPMVSSKSQHLLKSIYTGRTSFDDNASVAGFSDVFMDSMQPGRPGKAVKNGPFEFVDENNMDFEHYKNRPEFRDQAGGDGQLFGRAPDMSRPGTPGSMTTLSRADTADWEGHSRDNSDQSYGKGNNNRHSQYGSREHSQSRDSSLTRVPDVGVEYPRGYHQTPSNLREQSPGGMGYDSFRGRGYNLSQPRSRDGLVNQAAPMAQATPYAPAPGGYSMAGTPGYETPGEETSYDYFRRGRQYH